MWEYGSSLQETDHFRINVIPYINDSNTFVDCSKVLGSGYLKDNATLQLIQEMASSVELQVESRSKRSSHNGALVANMYGICYPYYTEPLPQETTQFHPASVILEFPAFDTLLPDDNSTLADELQKAHRIGALFFGDALESMTPTTPTHLKHRRTTIISIKQTQMRFISTNRKPCELVKQSEFANHELFCWTQITPKNYTCRFLFGNLKTMIANSTRFCHSSNEWGFDGAQLSDAEWNNLSAFHQACQQQYFRSTIPCHHTVTEITVNDISGAETTKVIINYNFPFVTTIEEHEIYTWQVFLSNVGGLISLLCGASVISVAQLIYYVVQFCTNRQPPRRRKQAGATVNHVDAAQLQQMLISERAS